MLQSAEAYSWEPQVIEPLPEIAEHHLSNKSKKKTRKILGDQKLAYYANWPDFVKSDSLKRYKETEIWHYVNVTPKLSFSDFENELKQMTVPNLYSAIQKKQEAIVKDKILLKLTKKSLVIF